MAVTSKSRFLATGAWAAHVFHILPLKGYLLVSTVGRGEPETAKDFIIIHFLCNFL